MGYRFFPQSSESRAIERHRQEHLLDVGRRWKADELHGVPSDRERFATLRDLGRRRALRSQIEMEAIESPPPAAVIALNRLGFGPRPGDIAAFDSMGATDPQRLSAWLAEQLNPVSINDSAADNRIAQSGFSTLNKSLTDLWQDHVVNYVDWDNHIQPAREVELATFLRAIHSKRQLFELMVDFWHNHFNVYAWDYPNPGVWVHTDRDVIRAHALGNFRQMIEAVTKSPTMLNYLDNKYSTLEDANENYAREFLELHTMGSMHYLGNLDPGSIPTGPGGVPVGYVEADVIAAARCLTGWTVSDRGWDPNIGDTGEFLYYDPWHDQGAKSVIGTSLAADGGMQDGLDLFDAVASHPGTAVHIATKLARRLVGDFPPQPVVDAAALAFSNNVSAPDQIAQTIEAIVLAPEFLNTWGDKVKRPFEVVVSAFRGAGGDIPFEIGDPDTDSFRWMYQFTGQGLFSWHPPNGYPDFKAAWNSSAPRVRCWRMANWCVEIDDASDNHYFDLLAATPASARSAYEIVDFWVDRLYGRQPPSAEYDELVDFMAQGHNPAFDLPLDTDVDTQERLRSLVALMMMSPSFLWK